VKDPQFDVTVFERLRARRAVGGSRDVLDAADLRIDPLGSGSDYTPFLQHLGIASLNLSFSGEGGGGSYHSQYDSFDHYTRFIDPDFAYGVALSKVAGRATMRLANADVVPLRFGNLVASVKRYSDEVTALADSLRRTTETRNRLLRMNAYALADDPREKRVPPDSQATVPYFAFAPLQNALARLERAADAYDGAVAGALATGVPPGRAAEIDRALAETERRLVLPEGLPRRPWYRHQIYAPGFYTGYGVKTLPGIREGLEERKFDEAAEHIGHVASAIERVSEAVERAAALLKGATQQE
jgi:N-acetylated-alpha-linked acidic dipeptidase